MGLATGIGVGIQFSRGGSQSWEQQWQEIASDEYQAIYDAMTVKPTGLDLAVQNWFVYQMKAKNLWTKFDIIRFYGAQSNDNKEALLNWKNPTDTPSMMKGTYGTFNNGTEVWSKYGTNTCVNLGTEIKISYVDNTNGVYLALTSTYIDPITVAGKPYTIRARCKIESGTAALREVYSAVSMPITSSEYEWYEISFVRHASACYIGITLSIGAVVYCDEYYIFESHKALTVNAPTFTVRKGFTGIAANSTYLDQLYHIATSAVKYTLNSAVHILYILNSELSKTGHVHGAFSGTAGSKLFLMPSNDNKYLNSGINSPNTCIEIYNPERQGLYINSRTSSDKIEFYKNRELISSGTEVSVELPPRNIASLAVNTTNAVKISPSLFNNDQIFFEAFGEGLSKTEAEDTSDIINTVATYLGINTYKNNYKFDKPILVLSFDNFNQDPQTIGIPYFLSKGIAPTIYLVENEINSIYTELTWSNIIGWYNSGIDIQCHSKTHTQFQTLTPEEMIAELVSVNTAFLNNGLPSPKHFAYPYGAYTNTVIETITPYRLTARLSNGSPLAGSDYLHSFKYINKYKIPSYRCDRLQYTAEQIRSAIKEYMDNAILVNGALNITGHYVSNVDDGGTNTSDLDYWIDYARANDMDIMNMSQFYELLDK